MHPLTQFPLPPGSRYRVETPPSELLRHLHAMEQALGHDLSIGTIAGGILRICVTSDLLLAAGAYLRDQIGFAQLSCLSGVDLMDHLEVVYHVNHLDQHWLLEMTVPLSPGVAEIASVVALWPTADWQEREAFDMFGLFFTGHPDLRRILTDDEFVGFPLLKSFRITPLVAHDLAATQADPTASLTRPQEQGLGPQRVVPNLFSQGNQERLHPGTSTFGNDQLQGRSFPPLTWQHDSSSHPKDESRHAEPTEHS